MRSVADDIRREARLAAGRLTPEERIDLALRLGDDDAALFRALNGGTETQARATLARSRTVGRQPSVANEPKAP
jgi:hypothetical protein